jgi:cytochrome c-type biogenesis protein
MDYANVALALFAGLFSILSPCVLPLVPIVLGTAVSEHRLGPLALATGLATSFTAIGLFVATIGYSVGLDGEFFRVTVMFCWSLPGLLSCCRAFKCSSRSRLRR